jgi:hypothetical protein
MWTSQDAMSLQTPTPTIDAAVMARDLSGFGGLRRNLAACYSDAPERFPDDSQTWLSRLQQALQAATIITYAQGMSLLRAASHEYGYDISLEAVSRIWRGGCIIRARCSTICVGRFRQPRISRRLCSISTSQASWQNMRARCVRSWLKPSTFGSPCRQCQRRWHTSTACTTPDFPRTSSRRNATTSVHTPMSALIATVRSIQIGRRANRNTRSMRLGNALRSHTDG